MAGWPTLSIKTKLRLPHPFYQNQTEAAPPFALFKGWGEPRIGVELACASLSSTADEKQIPRLHVIIRIRE